MTDFVLKNNFFEFSREVKREKLGTAIGSKFAPPMLAFNESSRNRMSFNSVFTTFLMALMGLTDTFVLN